MLKVRRAVLGLTVLAIAAGVSAVALSAKADVIEQVLVRVNGEIVTKSEFERRQVNVLRTRPEFQGGNPTDAEVRKVIAELTPDLILSIVDELLLIQRGKEMGFALGDAQFATVLENIKKENKLERDEDFQAALKQEGMTMADFRRQMETSMLSSRVQQQEVADKVNVTDDEAKAYYAANSQAFTTSAEITLREILIEVPATNAGVNVAKDEEMKAKAEEVRKRLLAGEPFARLAAEVSDSPTKANGGLIGPFKRTDIAPALQKVIDPLKVGDVSEPVRTARGYQLIKLETRSAENVKSFEAARSEIVDRVGGDKLRLETLKYLDKLRDQAIIQWRNEELKKAYDVGLEKRRAALAPKG